MALERMQQLAHLTALRFQARQADMAKLMRQEAALRANLADLLAARRANAARAHAKTDVALAAGADVRWQVWADQRRAVINAELAQVLARRAALAEQLRIDFGKDQVAGKLLARQIAARRKARGKRDDQLS